MKGRSPLFSRIRRFGESPEIAVAIYTGVIAGLIDAAVVAARLGVIDQIDYVSKRVWVESALLWIIACVGGTVLMMIVRLGRFAVPLLVLGAATLLLTVRILVPLRFFYPDHARELAVAWVALVPATLGFAVWALRRRLQPSMSRLTRIVAWGILTLVVLASVRLPPNVARFAMRESGRPNVVLIFLDTLRYDGSGLDGQTERAPHLARFGSTGLVFENAYAPFPWSLPSHVAVLCGEEANESTVGFGQQTYAGKHPTLAQALRRNAYHTAGIFSNAWLNPGSGLQRDFDEYEYSQRELGLCRTSIGFVLKVLPNSRVPLCRMTAADVRSRAIDFISGARRPYFLALNYMEPHLPLYVPRRYRPEGYRPFVPLVEYPKFDLAFRRQQPVAPEALRKLITNYRIAVRYLDDELHKLIAAIESSPDGKNTIIAIVSDHGEQFGEHNLLLHTNSVYRQVLQVPLVLKGPGIHPGRISQPVSIGWLYAELLARAGIRTSAPRVLPLEPTTTSGPVFGAYDASPRDKGVPSPIVERHWSVFAGSLHLIVGENGNEELYDLAADPEETRNIASDKSREGERLMLRRILNDAFAGRNFTEQQRNLRSLGYMQ